MKVNGAYKFRTKANKSPCLKIFFGGTYTNQNLDDKTWAFFIATPGKEIEEFRIEYPGLDSSFSLAGAWGYYKSVGSGKDDWVATIKAWWDSPTENDTKYLFCYKVGDGLTDEKPKEYTRTGFSDPKVLVNEIGEKKYETLLPTGCGFFSGSNPYRWTSETRSLNSSIRSDGFSVNGSSLSTTEDGVTVRTNTTTTSGGQGNNIIYFFDGSGLITKTIAMASSSNSSYYQKIQFGSTVASNYSQYFINQVWLFRFYSEPTYLYPPFNGITPSITYSGPTQNQPLYNVMGCIEEEYYLSKNITYKSSQSSSQTVTYSSGLNVSSQWNLKVYSTALTSNLTHSFLFETTDVCSGNRANLSTTVYCVSLSDGQKKMLCQSSRNRTGSNVNTTDYWGGYIDLPHWYNSDYDYNFKRNSINRVSYVYKNPPPAESGIVESFTSSIENEEAMELFMEAIVGRLRSVLHGDVLTYVKEDLESDDIFLKQDYLLDVLTFDINNISDFKRENIKIKPSIIPEHMENFVVTGIISIQFMGY
jgi:hypothetical protein